MYSDRKEGDGSLREYKKALYPYEEIYEYIGTSETQIFRLISGVTYPGPDYDLERKHARSHTIEYIYEGEGVVQEDSHIYKVSAGDFFILHPNTFHHYYSSKENPWKKIFFTVKENSKFITRLLQMYKIDDVVFFPQTNTPFFLPEIMELLKSDETDVTYRMEDYIIRTLVSLGRFYQEVRHSDENTSIAEAKAYIDKHITERIALADVARNISLDRAYLSRAFKLAYGVSPSQYILKQKITLAETMLSDTGLSVEDIALRLSFYDVSHFSHTFTKIHGMSPSEYRNLPVQNNYEIKGVYS